MKRVIFLGLLLFVFAVPLRAQTDSIPSGAVWNLKQCIDFALANSLTVKRSNYNVESSEVDLRQAKFSRLPSLNANASYGYSWGRGLDPVSNDFVSQEITSSNVGAQAALPLFNGLRIHNAIRQTQQFYAASQQDLLKTKNDLIINVATLYINVVFNKELVENARLQLASSQQQLEQTSKQVRAGALPKAEQLNMDAQVATNEVNLIQQENSLALSLLQLKQALQIPDSQEFDVEVPALEPEDLTLDQSRDEVYDIARQIMPEIKSAALKIESADYAVKASRGNLYPRLSLVANLNTNYSSAQEAVFYPDGTFSSDAQPFATVGQDFENVSTHVYRVVPGGTFRNTYGLSSQFKDNIYRTLGFQLTIPIFNNYTSRASYQRTIIDSQLARVNAEETANTLRQNVETAYNNAVASSKTYNASLRQVRAREEAFRINTQRREIGAVNFLEYQVSENDLFRAKSDLLRAKYDFIFRKKVLDLYQGKPLEY